MSERDTPVMDKAGWDAYPSLQRNLVAKPNRWGVQWVGNATRRPQHRRHELDPDRDLTYGEE